jgi:hypothetical protein
MFLSRNYLRKMIKEELESAPEPDDVSPGMPDDIDDEESDMPEVGQDVDLTFKLVGRIDDLSGDVYVVRTEDREGNDTMISLPIETLIFMMNNKED